MRLRTGILIVLLLVVPVLVYFLWPSDEARIRKLFREGAAAIEAKQPDEVMKRVSFNYADDFGLTYLYLKEAVQRLFKRMEKMDIEYEIKGIAVEGQKATADVEVRVIARAGSDAGYIVGDAGKAQAMRFFLEKERTTWLIVRTEGMKAVMWTQ